MSERTAKFPFDIRTTEVFALISSNGFPVLPTIRSRKREVPQAATEWSGQSLKATREFGYRIGKVWVITPIDEESAS